MAGCWLRPTALMRAPNMFAAIDCQLMHVQRCTRGMTSSHVQHCKQSARLITMAHAPPAPLISTPRRDELARLEALKVGASALSYSAYNFAVSTNQALAWIPAAQVCGEGMGSCAQYVLVSLVRMRTSAWGGAYPPASLSAV